MVVISFLILARAAGMLFRSTAPLVGIASSTTLSSGSNWSRKLITHLLLLCCSSSDMRLSLFLPPEIDIRIEICHVPRPNASGQTPERDEASRIEPMKEPPRSYKYFMQWFLEFRHQEQTPQPRPPCRAIGSVLRLLCGAKALA